MRTSRVVLAIAVAMESLVLAAAPATAAPDTWCAADLGGTWDGQSRVCSWQVTSDRNAVMSISMAIPTEMFDDPSAGAAIRTYTHQIAASWRGTGETMVRDSTASMDYQVFSHSSAVKSVVFHEVWQTSGLTANNAYRAFSFDIAHGRPLEFADIFRAGVDPLTAVPALAEPYLPDALDAAAPPHDPDSYPFTTQEWEPHGDGSGYSGNYRAFALGADELILYMPDAPMAHEDPRPHDRLVWSMDGGTVIARVPLSALASILRPL